jgi:hypothetical protein
MNKNNILILFAVVLITVLTILNFKNLKRTPQEVSQRVNFYALYDLLHDPMMNPNKIKREDYEKLLKNYQDEVLMPERYVDFYVDYEKKKTFDEKFQFFTKLEEKTKLDLLKNYQKYSKVKPHKREPLHARYEEFQKLKMDHKLELIQFWKMWKRLSHPDRRERYQSL